MRHVDALSRASCLMIEDSLRHQVNVVQMEDDWIKAVRKILETGPYEVLLNLIRIRNLL